MGIPLFAWGNCTRIYPETMLTDTKIRQAKPATKPYKLFDDRGLFLIVTPNGGKWWRLKFRLAGREKGLSLVPILRSRWPPHEIGAMMRESRLPVGLIRARSVKRRNWSKPTASNRWRVNGTRNSLRTGLSRIRPPSSDGLSKISSPGLERVPSERLPARTAHSLTAHREQGSY